MLAIIPARGGSKGIVGKNIRDLHGHPLIAWTISAALRAGIFSRVVVSTDSDEIGDVSRQYGAQVVVRPDQLATDTAPAKGVVIHVCDTLEQAGYRTKHLAYLQPTSPLRDANDIIAATQLVSQGGFDSAASFGLADPHPDRAFYLTPDGAAEPVGGHDAVWLARQERDPRYHLNGAIYVLDADMLRAETSARMLPGRIGAYVMPEARSVDVDTVFDLKICELLLEESNPEPPLRVPMAQQ
jgi:CMP-N,N'-diacetyllegionaminic acid synthase